jgi:cytidylate kinase
MPVIAMSRELGTLGCEIASGLASDLGLKLVRHEIVDRLARRSGLPASEVLRCFEGRASLLDRLRADLEGLAVYAEEAVLELAAAGDVILRGWGATHLLRAVPHVLCVRVCAPLDLRARRVTELFGLRDMAQARQKVRDSDAVRDAAMRRRFGADWQDATRYDMVLNTEHMSAERCIHRIRRGLQFPDCVPTRESAAMLGALALSARLRAALRQDHRTSALKLSVQADANGSPGSVALHGIVADERERRMAQAVAQDCPGVRQVHNRLRSMRAALALRFMDS